MSLLTRFKFFLWYFSHFKVALIGYVRPRLLVLNDEQIVIRIPLNRRTRNHLNSMYFGALSIGADVAGGFHGFYHAEQAQCKVMLAFKSFQAQFLKRPESNVYFVCNDGAIVKAMIAESKQTGERVNKPIHIKGFTQYPNQPEAVADFILELSLKVLK